MLAAKTADQQQHRLDVGAVLQVDVLAAAPPRPRSPRRTATASATASRTSRPRRPGWDRAGAERVDPGAVVAQRCGVDQHDDAEQGQEGATARTRPAVAGACAATGDRLRSRQAQLGQHVLDALGLLAQVGAELHHRSRRRRSSRSWSAPPSIRGSRASWSAAADQRGLVGVADPWRSDDPAPVGELQVDPRLLQGRSVDGIDPRRSADRQHSNLARLDLVEELAEARTRAKATLPPSTAGSRSPPPS